MMLHKNQKEKIQMNRGAALITSLVLFTAISVFIIIGISFPVLTESRIIQGLERSRTSYFTAESGIEDIVYRMRARKNTLSTNVLTLNNSVATTTIQAATFPDSGFGVVATGKTSNTIQKVEAFLAIGSGAAFNFGVQAGDGGFYMENSSTVVGNVYSNGPVFGSVNSLIRGGVASGGPDGLIDGAHATGTAFAHTIQNAYIEEDAYYVNLTNTVVGGQTFPNSPDKATTTLPIPDNIIEEWKAAAEAGGVITSPCPYTITDDATIGPVKIECDLEISGNNYVITVEGPIWVEGDITIRNGPTIRAASAVGSQSIPIVADNPIDRITSSTVVLDNSVEFEGSGQEGSYILFVSKNNDALNGGSTPAIEVSQSVSGDLLVYAGEGEIRLGNSVDLIEVTAYRVRLQNFSVVTYRTGIASLIFTTGPGGGYTLREWIEIE